MKVDMRVYPGTREAVHAGIAALWVQGRQIWGDTRHTFPEIVTRLTVGIGDLARLARDGSPVKPGDGHNFTAAVIAEKRLQYQRELKKELGNIIFSTIRWIDDLGLDVLECLDLAIEAQEKFAQSGRPR
jgi:hypothetical protein